MVSNENLKKLFEAYKAHNDTAFFKVAEVIILELLASNNQALATYIKKLVYEYKDSPSNSKTLSVLSNKMELQNLIFLQQSFVDGAKLVLASDTRQKISRILEEHSKHKRLEEYGYRPKNKILLWGPPGCGKTYTANYIAYELGIQIGTVNLSSLISSYLGDTSSNLESIFNMASKTPMVLLIDEVDSIGKNRDDKNDVGELKRVVNSFLQLMDNFNSHESIIVAASNHHHLLDTALWRRFDDIINFPYPSFDEAEIYLTKLLNGVNYKSSINTTAKLFLKNSYSDIKRITEEAIKTMILDNKKQLNINDLKAEIAIFNKSSNHNIRNN